MTAKSPHSKLQRWTDLLAALLARRLGGTFDQLARDVPAYAGGLQPEHKESIKRAFERDKDELREFGIPIETVHADDSEETKYHLRSTQFYLPFLALEGDDGDVPAAPAGYRDLATVTLTPEDLSLIGEAVARLEQLGDPLLAEDARSAAGKLGFELFIFDRIGTDVHLLDADSGADEKVFAQLSDALHRRKLVTFSYRKPSGGATERRVEPYGLFFVGAHWYLAAHDRTRDAVRNFRVSRIREVDVNRKKANSSDYDIPGSFRLREHAQSRDAWELGDALPVVAEVRFVANSGASAAAARIGEPVPDTPDVRRFTVRRLETFARWLLAFAGDAQPLAPPELLQLHEKAVRETLALYTGHGRPTPSNVPAIDGEATT